MSSLYYDDEKHVLDNIIKDISNKATNALKEIRNNLTTNALKKIDINKIIDTAIITGTASTGKVNDANDLTSKTPNSMPHPFLPNPTKVQQLFSSWSSNNSATQQGVIYVGDTLSAFILRAVALDPVNNFDINYEFSPAEVDRLIKICVNHIVQPNVPKYETVKMQVYFDTHFPAQADFLHKEKVTRVQKCSHILRDITENKSKSVQNYENLYRKIAAYVLVKGNIGNPADMRIIKENSAALESVFPQSELATFVQLTRSEREEQLNGLAQLVTGIRLFNKQLGKGGDSIDNLPEICADELRLLNISVDDLTKETEDTIQLYLAIHSLFKAKMEANQPLPINVDLDRIKAGLTFRRQLLMYLDALKEQMTKSRTTLLALSTKFDNSIRELKTTCRARTAVSVDQVYPQFILLSSLWSNWLDELFLLCYRRGILDMLEFFTRSFEIEIPIEIKEEATPFLGEIEPDNLPDSEVIKKATELMGKIAVINRSVEVLHPGITTQYYELPVEYGGFCSISLVNDGLILPGNKNIGLCKYKDCLYAFADFNCAIEFAKNPEKWISSVIDTAKSSADLVQLFHLYQYFPTVEALENARSYTKQRLLGQIQMVSEVGCQVDTHIVDKFIDKNYQWNEWEMRRNALMLVNLRNKVTHGSQTVISHFKRESETQHYEPKDQTSQTRRDFTKNVPRKVNFQKGLRHDGKNNSYKVVDLTFEMP